jgi:DNA helicase HerA-like ATPase
MSDILARVKAPGDRPHTFLMVTPDTEQRLRQGEFVTYQANIDGNDQAILARITERRAIHLYPDSFLADPSLDPNTISATVGYSGSISDLSELTAEVIGYYDETFRDFINPGIPPRVGTPVSLAENGYLSEVLSRATVGETGSATMGWLSSRAKGNFNITVDIDAIASTHLAVIASTGAGKSYAASVLVEEMLHPKNKAAILVIDPHGEYETLEQIANYAHFRADDYRPSVSIRKPGQVKIRVGTLPLGDFRYLLPNLSDRMAYVLGIAYRKVQSHSRRNFDGDATRWTVSDLEAALEDIAGDENSDYGASAGALLWRLNSTIQVGNERVFDNNQQTRLTELLHPGNCTVMQLNQVDPREQQVIVASLMRRIYQARLKTERGDVDESNDYYLPYPVFVLIEEAHNYAPANANAVSTGVLKQVLSEGRKFGVGVGLISQRPGKLDSDILS